MRSDINRVLCSVFHTEHNFTLIEIVFQLLTLHCRECLGEAHAPCGCSQWHQWQQKISEVKPEELRASCVETEDAANCLWLVTNSKPCPNCKSPIQKNEGCNHMKCSKVLILPFHSHCLELFPSPV